MTILDRSTNTPSQLRLLNIVCRGGAQEWRALYADCRHDARTRAGLRALLPMVEPELIGTRRLWEMLLERIETTP